MLNRPRPRRTLKQHLRSIYRQVNIKKVISLLIIIGVFTTATFMIATKSMTTQTHRELLMMPVFIRQKDGELTCVDVCAGATAGDVLRLAGVDNETNKLMFHGMELEKGTPIANTGICAEAEVTIAPKMIRPTGWFAPPGSCILLKNVDAVPIYSKRKQHDPTLSTFEINQCANDKWKRCMAADTPYHWFDGEGWEQGMTANDAGYIYLSKENVVIGLLDDPDLLGWRVCADGFVNWINTEEPKKVKNKAKITPFYQQKLSERKTISSTRRDRSNFKGGQEEKFERKDIKVGKSGMIYDGDGSKWEEHNLNEGEILLIDNGFCRAGDILIGFIVDKNDLE